MLGIAAQYSYVMELPSKLRRSVREKGLVYSLQRAFWGLVPRRFVDINCWDILEFDVRKWADAGQDIAGFRWITQEDASQFGRLLGEEFEARLLGSAEWCGGRARLAVIEKDARLVAWSWLTPLYHDQDDWLRISLGPTDIWYSKTVVVREYRRQGLAYQMNEAIFAEMAASGYRRAFGALDALNRAARGLWEKCGAKAIGRVHYIRIMGLTFVHVAGKSRLGCWHSKRCLEIPIDIFAEGMRNQLTGPPECRP